MKQDSGKDGDRPSQVNSAMRELETSSKDEYIRNLQAELEQLKEHHCIGSTCYKRVRSQSPVSKKNGSSGHKVCS